MELGYFQNENYGCQKITGVLHIFLYHLLKQSMLFRKTLCQKRVILDKNTKRLK